MSARLQRRARRLVALYPRAWRARFGEEFEQLLLDDLRDRPRSPLRAADITAHAVLAHLTAAGVAGRGLSPQAQVARGLRTLGVIVALFLAFAVGIWSQLDIGWSWAPPAADATRGAIVVMSAALLGLLSAAVLATALVGCASVRAIRHGSTDQRLSLLLALVCGAILVLGCAHFMSQWPGGRHPAWGEHSPAPPVLAQFGWASTQWVTAYWLHPHALALLPGHRLMWAVISPLLLIGMVVAALHTTRSISLSPAMTRTLALIGAATGVLAALFVAAAASWILSAGTGPREVFQAGSVDDVVLIVLSLALAANAHVMRRVAGALRQLRSA